MPCKLFARVVAGPLVAESPGPQFYCQSAPGIYLDFASKLPENLMVLHGVVIFLEFFAIKAFLMEWLDKGAPGMEVRLHSVDTDEVSTQQNISSN